MFTSMSLKLCMGANQLFILSKLMLNMQKWLDRLSILKSNVLHSLRSTCELTRWKSMELNRIPILYAIQANTRVIHIMIVWWNNSFAICTICFERAYSLNHSSIHTHPLKKSRLFLSNEMRLSTMSKEYALSGGLSLYLSDTKRISSVMIIKWNAMWNYLWMPVGIPNWKNKGTIC